MPVCAAKLGNLSSPILFSTATIYATTSYWKMMSSMIEYCYVTRESICYCVSFRHGKSRATLGLSKAIAQMEVPPVITICSWGSFFTYASDNQQVPHRHCTLLCCVYNDVYFDGIVVQRLRPEHFGNASHREPLGWHKLKTEELNYHSFDAPERARVMYLPVWLCWTIARDLPYSTVSYVC